MNLKEASRINPNAILVKSGVLFDVFNPKIEDIDIEDIAHALSNICRYGGHSPKFYSVAQHCVLCSYQDGTPLEQLEFLMHDASEAYLGDVPRPIKKNMPNYILIEDKLLELIFKKFNLNFPLSKRVKEVDDYLLSYEYSNFFDNPNSDFEIWDSEKSKTLFMSRFKQLFELVNQDSNINSEFNSLI